MRVSLRDRRSVASWLATWSGGSTSTTPRRSYGRSSTASTGRPRASVRTTRARSSWRTKHLAEVREAFVAAAREEAAPQAAGPRGGTKVPFEALMDEWSKTWEGQKFVQVAHRILTYAMNVGFRCAFPECADRLDDLVARVAPTIVVTVNYDTLTEEALQRRSLRVFYPRLYRLHDAPWEGPGDVVPVFKLHGSVDWLALHGVAGGADLKIVQRQARRQRSRVVRSGHFAVTQTWNTYPPPNRPSLFHEIEESPNAGETVVAAYSSGKYLFNNPLDVRRHRRACFEKLGSEPIGRVVAIGIRPVSRRDDPVTHRLFALLRGIAAEKVYVSPSPDDRRKLERYGVLDRQWRSGRVPRVVTAPVLDAHSLNPIIVREIWIRGSPRLVTLRPTPFERGRAARSRADDRHTDRQRGGQPIGVPRDMSSSLRVVRKATPVF